MWGPCHLPFYQNKTKLTPHTSISADVAAKVLDRKNCLRVLEELKHANWFQTNVSPVPSAVIALRVLHHIMRQEGKEHWRKAVQPWILDVLVGMCFCGELYSSRVYVIFETRECLAFLTVCA